MAFARIETGILNHPKFTGLCSGEQGLAALGLWTLGLAYSMDQLTDGNLPRSFLLSRVRANTLKCSAERLVAAGLWIDKGDHYMIHDYLEWNPSAQQIKAGRQAARDRMKQRRGSGEQQQRSGERSHEQFGSFARTQSDVRQQDVEVDKTENTPPRTASPVRPNREPYFDWPSPQVKAASARGETGWLPGRLPYEAFHHDCPERSWRGQCVRSDYATTHPGAYPALDNGVPKQCPTHRKEKPSW